MVWVGVNCGTTGQKNKAELQRREPLEVTEFERKETSRNWKLEAGSVESEGEEE